MKKGTKNTYVLHQTWPDGETRARAAQPRKRDAAALIMYALMDSRKANRRDATALAFEVEKADLGTTVTHESGYAFRIEAE